MEAFHKGRRRSRYRKMIEFISSGKSNSYLTYAFSVLVVVIPGTILLIGWPAPYKSGSAQANSQNMVVQGKSLQEPIKPLPLYINLDQKKVKLGEQLFNDKRLSGDNSVSCASCHDLSKGGTDNLPRSIGIDSKEGTINSPTVFNSGLNFRQFWDGRAATLEDQIDGPMLNPMELGSTWKKLLSKLRKDPTYIKQFKEVYKAKPSRRTVRNAIAEFEKSLYTPNSRFDQYLMGNKNAITKEELEGYNLFRQNGCIACHQGKNIGGNMFQSFGVVGNYFKHRGNITKADYGRYNVTHKESDRFVFKVPSLRNVARTAPYFHDGSAATLEEAVGIMARFQLGRTFSTRETALIVKFLHTLTGEYKGKPL